MTTVHSLKLDRVSKSYSGAIVLRDVHFEVEPSDFLALRGANGSGKSTLLAIASGVLRPTSGTVSVNGLQFRGSAAERARGNIGYLPQKYSLPSSLRTRELISAVVRLRDEQRDERVWIDELFEGFGLDSFRDIEIAHLSGGTKQKVAIVAAIVNRPMFLILDEPLAGLDDNSREFLLDLLSQLAATGTGIVVASHGKDVVSSAHHVVEVSKGALNTGARP